MTKHLLTSVLAIICLGLLPAYSQPGPARGPRFGGAMDKLFGENRAFSATMEMQVAGEPGSEPMTMPGKLSFDSGKSRFEVDIAQARGGSMTPEAAAQAKSLGMDRMVTIGRPDKNVAYMIYPGMQAYVENPIPVAETGASSNDFKVAATELGKETVDAHPCVKNKMVVTDPDGTRHEFTVWNASDLKKFPVKITQTEQGNMITTTFKGITLSKPDASLFNPPADYTRYDNLQTMMQQVIMKRMGAPGGPAPGQ